MTTPPPESAGGIPPEEARERLGDAALRAFLRNGLEGAGPDGVGLEIRPGLRLLEPIGEGGTGRVFLAEETAPLRRTVAVKRPCLEGLPPDWQPGFAREWEALARLDHPNVARVFETGIDAEGLPFYSMELVDGPALVQFCTRGRLGIAARLRLFVTVCLAVQHAHQRGVLHGDLKPSNILVAVDEQGAPVPKLIDFAAGGAFRRHFGTPGYAGPEQYAVGRPPDARSDVHALGVILRELAGTEETVTSAREVSWIVARATSDVPEQRYATAAALAEDVERWLAGRPLHSAPPGAGALYRAGKFLRRHRRACLVAPIALAVAVGVASGGVFLAERARASERLARAARHEAALDAARSEIARRLSEASDRQALGRYDDAARALAVAGAIVARLPPEDAAWLRDVQRAQARLFLVQRRYPEAEALLADLARAGDERPESWEARLDLIRLHLETRRFDDAASGAEGTLEALRRRFPPGHPLRLRAVHLAGRVHVERFRYPEAHEALSEAVEGFRRHFGPDAVETRQALGDLAEVEQVLRDQERLPGPSGGGR